MAVSSAYVIGALDVLVKAGEVSPAYAKGVADALLEKDAGWLFDTEAENLGQQWDDYLSAHPGAYNQQTGHTSVAPDQAKRMIDQARPWYDNMGGRAMSNVRHWGRVARSWLPGWLGGGDTAMSAAESRRLLEHERNEYRQDYLNRSKGSAPSALYAAAQDAMTRDARNAYYDQKGYMSDAEHKARFGEDADDAADKFRTVQGTRAMQNGFYTPRHDKQSATPTSMTAKSTYNRNPLAGMYGSKERNRLFTQSYRNGLGMY